MGWAVVGLVGEEWKWGRCGSQWRMWEWEGGKAWRTQFPEQGELLVFECFAGSGNMRSLRTWTRTGKTNLGGGESAMT